MPQYGTRRRPERETTGTQVAEVAARYGITLKPWQQYAADVMGELDPATGQHAYDRILLSVGRRAGKTLLLWLQLLAMARNTDEGIGFFTRQTQKDAVLSWQLELAPLMDRDIDGWKLFHGAGNQRAEYAPRRSQVRLFSPTAHSLHGSAANQIVFDEIFVHDRDKGRDLEIAAGPLLWTRPGGQLILASAAGDLDSTWLADWTAAGREAAAEDRGTGTCHIEYTADGTGLDPDDPATWRIVHPGELPDAVYENEYHRDREYFKRTMLNIPDRSSASKAALDQALWAKLGIPPVPRTGLVTLGVDAGPEQSSASIVACYDEGRVVEVVETGDGVDWVLPRLLELHDRWELYGVAVDPGAPVGQVVAQMHQEGLPVVESTLRQSAAAAAQFASAVKHSQVRYVRDPAFDVASVAARRRNVGDGAWTFSRLHSTGDVTPVIAASLARAAHPDVSGAGAVNIG